MNIRYLGQEEKEKSRSLYETSFPEDSEEFVDYYYTEKCTDNQILVMEDYDEVVSMIHLNPFTVSMYGQQAKVHYIVAVATHEDYRMQGYMRQLMERVFHDMYEAGEPFAFLTPANPDYYYSCGFEYWENQIQLHQDQDGIWNGRQRISVAVDADCAQMADFSNETLSQQFDLFVVKDEAYYHRLIKEQECDGGHILVIKEGEDGAFVNEEEAFVHEAEPYKDVQIAGIFCLNKGMGTYIREPILAHSYSEEIHAGMMGRVLNVERFCGMLKSNTAISLDVRIRDTMIPENEDCYHIEIGPEGGFAQRIYDVEPVLSMDIAELGQMFFDKMRIYINEVV